MQLTEKVAATLRRLRLEHPVDGEILTAEEEAQRIAEIKKKYRYRYPNINDPIVRITKPVEEDSSCDETFSSLTPKELEKRRKKKLK